MRKNFVCQKPSKTIDFGAASAQIGQVFDPEIYNLRIESACVVENQNTLVALDLIEATSGARVAIQTIWVDGPNANVGGPVARNRHLIAQLLKLAGKPTIGGVRDLIPELTGLTFKARLVLSTDDRTGLTFNKLAEIFTDDKS